MILKEIELENFGIYGGRHRFDLSLEASEKYNRPIVLLRGKNGVGKSTLVEAIRLCLHGPVSLGSRIGQREYDIYLLNRLHRIQGMQNAADRAAIRLSFEHTGVGQKRQYVVERTWTRNKTGVSSSVKVWEDNALLEVSPDERESILRELIPPGVVDLFFFDGEKIATLAEVGAESDLLLAETVRNLLGLHLVEQLDRDLDVYLTRQRNARQLHLQQMELEALRSEESELLQQHESIRSELSDCRQRMQAQRRAISKQEQELSALGGSLAERRQSNEARHQQIIAAITAQELEIFELSRDLVPFAMAPKLLMATRSRLMREAEYERWAAVQSVLDDLKRQFAALVPEESYWEGVANFPDAPAREAHLLQINTLLSRFERAPMDESEVVHHLSSEIRTKVLNWIDVALNEVPQALSTGIAQLVASQAELRRVTEELERTPREEVLAPIQDELRRLERELGRLEAEQERLSADEQRLQYLLERNAGSRRRVSEQIAQTESDGGRMQLAARTKLLLAEYHQKLVLQKLRALENRIAERFNQLCRKRNFIERVSIAPDDYRVMLYRDGQVFPRNQLSAGEQQLFAVATLWALREISGRPMPVLIDTPLSRLDTEHRRSMVEEFFTQVAHQVIIFATDAEMDEKTVEYLRPAISRIYTLADTPETGSSQASIEYADANQPMLRLEEIRIDAK